MKRTAKKLLCAILSIMLVMSLNVNLTTSASNTMRDESTVNVDSKISSALIAKLTSDSSVQVAIWFKDSVDTLSVKETSMNKADYRHDKRPFEKQMAHFVNLVDCFLP